MYMHANTYSHTKHTLCRYMYETIVTCTCTCITNMYNKLFLFADLPETFRVCFELLVTFVPTHNTIYNNHSFSKPFLVLKDVSFTSGKACHVHKLYMSYTNSLI